MAQDIITSTRPGRRVLKPLGGALTAAVMLSVPALALSSVVSWGFASGQGQDRPAIAASDDAVANGLRIVSPPPVLESAQATPATRIEAETLLRDWQFTKLPGSQGS